MNRQTVRAGGTELAVFSAAADSPAAGTALVWAHGWGHTHQNMLPLARAMGGAARSILLDLPGFGASPLPPSAWSTADYADAIAEWLPRVAAERRIWVAHSFGCRIGLQIAARHPDAVQGLFLIAAAGLPRHRTPVERARRAARRWAFRLAGAVTPEGPARERLRERFGSADYRQAGRLRPILVKAVSEDLTAVARAVRCPTVLVYGDRDSETPPELGVRFDNLIPNSRLIILRGFDHWNVLTDGQHQIAQRLADFVEQIA